MTGQNLDLDYRCFLHIKPWLASLLSLCLTCCCYYSNLLQRQIKILGGFFEGSDPRPGCRQQNSQDCLGPFHETQWTWYWHWVTVNSGTWPALLLLPVTVSTQAIHALDCHCLCFGQAMMRRRRRMVGLRKTRTLRMKVGRKKQCRTTKWWRQTTRRMWTDRVTDTVTVALVDAPAKKVQRWMSWAVTVLCDRYTQYTPTRLLSRKKLSKALIDGHVKDSNSSGVEVGGSLAWAVSGPQVTYCKPALRSWMSPQTGGDSGQGAASCC